MGELTGKVAIVTGASKGIGAGIARALGKAGAAVAVNYASSKDGAERVVKEIAQNGGKAIAVQGDVAKPGDVKRLFEETKKAFGSLDILVNNAGVYEFIPLESVTEEEFHREFKRGLGGIDNDSAELSGLHGDQGRGRRGDAGTGQGTRAAEDSRQLYQPGRRGDRRDPKRWDRGQRLRKADGCADSAGAVWET